MARKIKVGLDYFPHACHLDDDLKYIIAIHKSDGYYVYFRLLEHIYSKGYYCEWNKKNIALFSDKVSMDIDKLKTIIDDCADEKLFSKKLLNDHNILTSKGIQERYLEASDRRKKVELINVYILIDNVSINYDNVDIIEIDVDISTQSKVKESKVNKSKVNHLGVFNYYLDLDLKKHKKFTETMKDSLNLFVKKTGETDTEEIKTILKRHEQAVKNKKGSEYEISMRGFAEFFGQKVYQGKELIAEQYMDGGKYADVKTTYQRKEKTTPTESTEDYYKRIAKNQ